MCLVCSGALEAFRAARTLLDPTEHAKHVEVVCSMQLLCRTGQTRGNRVVGERSDKAVGRLGGVWGP